MKKMFFALIIFAAFLAGCNSNDLNSAAGLRDVDVYLTDAPNGGDNNHHDGNHHNPWKRFSAVNLDIVGIQYLATDSLSKDSAVWTVIPFTEKIYNISMLSNGDSVLLSSFSIPENQIVRKIKFKLGKNSTVVLADNTVKPLLISNKSDSTLVVHVRNNVPKGKYSIMLDFDIAHSIVMWWDGNFYLKPVMRCFVRETTACVRGFVAPINLATKVFIVIGNDTIATVSDVNRDNRFKLDGLTKGKYLVQFMPLDSARVTATRAIEVRHEKCIYLGKVKVIN